MGLEKNDTNRADKSGGEPPAAPGNHAAHSSNFKHIRIKEIAVSRSDALSELICRHIREHGPGSFAWFMEQALYHPIYGYYSARRTRIGKAGDFFTNVSVGNLFGEILSGQFVELFDLLGAPDRFKILEQGAEDGQLARDVLSVLAQKSKASGWEYQIIEPSATRAAYQKAHLEKSPIPLSWVEDLDHAGTLHGIIFCNELLDALPCHVVEHDGKEWNEICVTEENGRLSFISCPIVDLKLARQVERLPTPLITPYRTEVNLAALDWTKSAARALTSGFILIIDYGFPRQEFYAPLRTEGTLTGYAQHRRQKDLLNSPGEIDITAHIDFSAIAEAALTEGCRLIGFTDQHHFMIGAAEGRLLEMERLANQGLHSAAKQKFLRQFKSLMHPNTMGLAFKYLLLAKGVTTAKAPTGFKYAKDRQATLQINVNLQ